MGYSRLDLKGRVAVVIGGNSGIGQVLARGLAEAGADVVPSGRRYQPGGIAMASKLGDSFEFIGNREYRDGDNLRDMDWRATARLSRPIVRLTGPSR